MAKVHIVDEIKSYVDLGKGQIFIFRTVPRFDGTEYKKTGQWDLLFKKEKEFSKYKSLPYFSSDQDAIKHANNIFKNHKFKKSNR